MIVIKVTHEDPSGLFVFDTKLSRDSLDEYDNRSPRRRIKELSISSARRPLGLVKNVRLTQETLKMKSSIHFRRLLIPSSLLRSTSPVLLSCSSIKFLFDLGEKLCKSCSSYPTLGGVLLFTISAFRQ